MNKILNDEKHNEIVFFFFKIIYRQHGTKITTTKNNNHDESSVNASATAEPTYGRSKEKTMKEKCTWRLGI